jgi:ferredoxin-type protein NapH
LSAAFGVRVLSGTLSAALILDTVPLADPFAVLQMIVARHWPHTTVLVGSGIVVTAYAVFFGRAFCGWVCPINLLSDAAAALNRKYALGSVLRLPRSTRYWVLGLALLLSGLLGVAVFEWVSPIGIAVRTIAYGSIGGLWALAALFVFELVILPHGICGHLCPLGAFWSLVGKKALLHINIDASKCTHCMECQTICPERQVISPLLKKDKPEPDVTAGACTRCGRCVEVCEPRALRLTVLPSTHVTTKETHHEAA